MELTVCVCVRGRKTRGLDRRQKSEKQRKEGTHNYDITLSTMQVLLLFLRFLPEKAIDCTPIITKPRILEKQTMKAENRLQIL